MMFSTDGFWMVIFLLAWFQLNFDDLGSWGEICHPTKKHPKCRFSLWWTVLIEPFRNHFDFRCHIEINDIYMFDLDHFSNSFRAYFPNLLVCLHKMDSFSLRYSSQSNIFVFLILFLKWILFIRIAIILLIPIFPRWI